MIHHVFNGNDWHSWRDILADIVEIITDKALNALVIMLSIIVGLFVWAAEGISGIRRLFERRGR